MDYKEIALELARTLIDKAPEIREDVEAMLPELKDNEDEITRKDLLYVIEHHPYLQSDEAEKYIAWLEKQAEKSNWKPSKDEMDALYGLAYITNKMDDKKDEAVTKLYQDLKREFFNGATYENMFPSSPVDSEINIEKQGEQKDILEDAILDSNEDGLIAETIKAGKAKKSKRIVSAEAKETMYDKPADKVEPKFKVGDKIIEKDFDECGCGTIIDIKDGKYIFDDGGFICIEEQGLWKLVEQKLADKVESKFHEGEWIVNNISKRIFLIKSVANGYCTLEDAKGRIFHPCLPHDGDFHLWTIQDAKDGDVLSDVTTIFIFKDLLSDGSVMSYCDYDTDSGESDAFCPLSVNLMCSKITPATKEQRDLLFSKMKEADYEWDTEHKQLKKIENESIGWTEDDKWMIKNIYHAFEEGSSQYIWLKSLKDRIGCEVNCTTTKEWKPSDEQMLAINTAINVLGKGTINGKYLIELHEQLKKLREE